MVLDSRQTTLGYDDPQENNSSYLDVETLKDLSDQDLEAIYEAIPRDVQQYLEKRYRGIKKQHHIDRDEAELRLIQSYIERYQYSGLVPTGEAKWVRLERKQRQAIESSSSDWDDAEVELGKPPVNKLHLIGLAGAFLAACIALTMLPRLLAASSNPNQDTPTPSPTATHTPTPVPTATPTATPLALHNSDTFVREGDTSNRDFFPVFLDVQLPDQEQPRVFVVQERLIGTTEWFFEPHPDVASWVSGTVIRPVVGIPYSESNAEFVNSIGPGALFTLRTNTGAALRFTFVKAEEVGRQDISLFRQSQPGFVLALLGQTDDFGMPTGTRRVILADYAASQEMDNIGELVHAPVQMAQLQSLGAVDMLVRDAYLLPASDDDMAQFVYAIVDIELNSSGLVDLATYQWFLEDRDGVRYSADFRALALAQHQAIPTSIDGSTQASIGFLVSRFTREAQLLVSPPDGIFETFSLTFAAPPIPANADRLDIQIRSIQRDARHLYVELRVYNPLETSITMGHQDSSVIFGFESQPIGTSHFSTIEQDITVHPGEALDATLTFNWNGRDPYAKLSIAGRVYSISLIE